MKTITVNASKSYDVIIGSDFLTKAGAMIREKAGGQTAAIVTDDNVSALYGKTAEDSLKNAGYRVVNYIFPHGEESKNSETFFSLINFLAAEKLSRTDVIVALGGGVTGDIAGFAASTFKRGTRLVQIPTTLLAAVDSSVGGKTGINLNEGKNQLGTFYQPDLVLCDVSLLSTLPPQVYSDGIAEVIKYGIIEDSELFNLLEKEIKEKIEEVIYRCIKIKRDIVSEDEFEQGGRKLLNFGHTVGHAIELLSDYKVSHGHAVAVGMAVETRAASSMGICNEQCLQDILSILDLYGLPGATEYSAKELANACLSDKKRDGDNISMVFPEKIGKCIIKEIPIGEVEPVIKAGLGRSK